MVFLLKIEEIKVIQKVKNNGYEIVFNNSKVIKLSKRRTIVGLLLLLKYQVSSEEDLTGTNDKLSTIKGILKGKIEENWIQDRYGDANKPFSELWTEEMFTFIRAEGFQGNRKYVLDIADHHKLFNIIEKTNRKQLSALVQKEILTKQNHRCNICGSIVKQGKDISERVFARDRVRLEFDHRIPVEKGGINDMSNYQALCHYCNKCKRQMCYICSYDKCHSQCALVYPEKYTIVKATDEDIKDRFHR